jgi:hypothetical protein
MHPVQPPPASREHTARPSRLRTASVCKLDKPSLHFTRCLALFVWLRKCHGLRQPSPASLQTCCHRCGASRRNDALAPVRTTSSHPSCIAGAHMPHAWHALTWLMHCTCAHGTCLAVARRRAAESAAFPLRDHHFCLPIGWHTGALLWDWHWHWHCAATGSWACLILPNLTHGCHSCLRHRPLRTTQRAARRNPDCS